MRGHCDLIEIDGLPSLRGLKCETPTIENKRPGIQVKWDDNIIIFSVFRGLVHEMCI